MVEESELEDDAPESPGTESAVATGLSLAAASREKADAFLDAQTAIARLQKEHLHEQRALQISHLKWRRFNDWMRSGGQAMFVVIGAVIVAAIATALWDASRANGLVVDSFTVPPDFEQRGMGGESVAGDVTDRLTAIREVAIENSYSNTNDVSQNRANEIKVDIPDTGISIGEAWRYLRRWLGHERHLTGSLRETGEGKVTLAASVEGDGAVDVTGPAAELPKLEQQLAEDIFGSFDPVNHINYLTATSRHQAAYNAAAGYVRIAKTVLQRSDSYGLWSYTTADASGDIELGYRRAKIGIGIDPDLAVLHVQAFKFDTYLGHDEDALRQARIVLSLRNADQLPAHQGSGFAEMQAEARFKIAWLTGDFSAATGWDCVHHCIDPILSQAALAARAHDVSRSRILIDDAIAAGAVNTRGEHEARYLIDAAVGDWAAAIAEASAARAAWMVPDGDISRTYLKNIAATTYGPMLAEAEAHAGRFADAHGEIDRTPPDCISCETARGDIDALQGNRNGAAYWYSRAIGDAPSIPFAYVEWGAMLLADGDLDGAIAKFRQASATGPHFADPLEMWGETLMLKNRSDLALPRFEEAGRYAPNWGRLHLEWGKALLYAGHKTQSRGQFEIASGLDLSRSERAVLAQFLARG
jgi:hypothetical protein